MLIYVTHTNITCFIVLACSHFLPPGLPGSQPQWGEATTFYTSQDPALAEWTLGWAFWDGIILSWRNSCNLHVRFIWEIGNWKTEGLRSFSIVAEAKLSQALPLSKGDVWLDKSKRSYERENTRNEERMLAGWRRGERQRQPSEKRPKSSFRFQGGWLLGKISNAYKSPIICVLTICLLYLHKKPLPS